MPDYKMGREWWKAEKISKSWFSSLMEMQRGGILVVGFFFSPIISQPVSHLSFPREDAKLRFECCVSPLPADIMKGGSEYSS